MIGGCTAAAANIFYNQPLLGNFASFFHVSVNKAGFVAASAQIGYGLGLLLFIPLGDKIERRTLILVLTTLCVATLAMTSLSRNFWMLVLTQFCSGLVAISTQLLIPLAVDLSPPARRGRSVGTLMTGVLCGFLFARTAGGAIGEYFGWQAVYWIAAGLTSVTAIAMYFMLPHGSQKLALSYPRLMLTLWELVRDEPALRNASLVSGTSFAAFCSFWAVLSFFMENRFHIGSAGAGMFGLVGVAGALFAPYAGRFSDQKGPRFTLTLAMAISIIAFFAMWLFVNIAGLILSVLLLDLGVQSAQIAAQSEIMDLRPGARNRLNTVYMVSRYAGGALGCAVGTLAYGHYGWKGSCIACICILAFGMFLHLWFERSKSVHHAICSPE